ncbi:hypothetical protein [Hymenobacter psychrotolerans]|uniref:MetA-pathway of phenol degradation n=1 Tax=Hymenobacter psychrotolerans DSM 18569 TaxID=1121959 RepID=A0A1M6XJ14_9BACT|nr:hypothetical protein [Hymenobacter psychrotolerans]SHL05957.1 hypothetical protein SAMN02746009_02056 [Hymenobacter psychrotolerans DSM 18569]
MRRFYTALIFLFGSLTSQAQGLPGYLITLAGDTVSGSIADATSHLLFYEQPNTEARKVWPKQVRGYGLRGRTAVRSRPVRLATGADSMQFVRPVQIGKASLYSYTHDQGLLLLPPATDTLYELTAANWRVLFNRHLHDCPTMDYTSWQMVQLPFTDKNIRQTIVHYSQCLGPEGQPKAEPQPGIWRHGLGVRTGAYFGGVQKNSLKGRGYLAGLEWTAVRASGWQMSLLGAYSRYTMAAESYSFIGTGGIQTDVQNQIRHHWLTLDLSFGQRIGRPNRLNLYLGGNIGTFYGMAQSEEYQERPTGSNVPFQTKYTTTSTGGLAPYLACSGGVIWPISPKHEVRLLGTYQYFPGDTQGMIGGQAAYTLFWK